MLQYFVRPYDSQECYFNRVSLKSYSHTGVRFLLREVAGQPEIGYPNVAVLVEEYVGGFQIAINDVSSMHVLEAEYHLGGVELHLRLVEDPVLAQMVMQIPAVHEIEDEAQLVGRVKRVRHTHYERAVDLLPTKK